MVVFVHVLGVDNLSDAGDYDNEGYCRNFIRLIVLWRVLGVFKMYCYESAHL